LCCRATRRSDPLLGEGRFVDDPHDATARVGRRDELLGPKKAWSSADVLVVPGGDVEELLQAETCPLPTFRAIGSMLLRSGQIIKPFDIV